MLASWAGSPTRFREDANAEEDLLLGGYAAAWLVELAQNAADAAGRAGAPGRVLVRLVDGELRVANTGAPLDRAGVTALASLRASAKRDEAAAVGQFGVGFAAVLAVSAEPRIVSTRGGVAFSTARTAAEVAALPGPAAELARRDGQLPVLRLGWPCGHDEPPPPAGYATEVRLPLRPEIDGDVLLAAAVDGAVDLLLALPGLAEIIVGDRAYRRAAESGGVLAVGGRRWRLARRSGVLTDAELAGLGVEQRGRRGWSLTWAIPVDGAGVPEPMDAGVLHAPTPTEERLTLPARLVATLPVEPSRRRIRPGPVASAVLAAAAPGYLELVRALPAAHRAALVPAAGFPASELDAQLRDRLVEGLRLAAWLPGADGAEVPPRQAVVLDAPGTELPRLLAGVIPGLLAGDAAPSAALAVLGVRRLGGAELADRLAGLARPPSWWHALYTALGAAVEQGHIPAVELAALPVPMVDARTLPGPASCALWQPESAVPEHLAGLPGLRIVHPDAAHPLLARLGATPMRPAELLDHPAVRAAVEQSVDDAEAGLDVAPLAGAVLALVEHAGPVGRPWLGALALPDADGEIGRADELVLPDAAIRPLLVPDAPLGVLAADVAAGTGRKVLTAVGVLDGFAVLDDDAPSAPDHGLDDEHRWWVATVAATDGRPPASLVAVRDLDLVDEHAWPAALRVLAADPACRVALRNETGGPPPYTAWWLARHAVLSGGPPPRLRLASASALDGLYDVADVPGVDEDLLAAIGVRAEAYVGDTAEAADLLARLADPRRVLTAATTRAAHAVLAAAAAAGRLDPDELDPPRRVRTVTGAVVDADTAAVLDQPWLAAVLDGAYPLVAGGDPAALADVLDLALTSELVRGAVSSTGTPQQWSELLEVATACAAAGIDVPDGELWLHEPLTVELTEPQSARGRRTVPVWRDERGRWHAGDPVRALLARLADEPG